MRDYDKELADSLDKSDQIAKLEAKVEELQRQLAESQEVGRNLSSTWKSTEDELKRQLAEAQDLASQINTDWIPANKRLAEKLAEREALIKEQLETITALNDALGGEGSLTTDNLVRVGRLERQLAEAQEMSKEIADVAYMSGSYDARKKAELQLAENDAKWEAEIDRVVQQHITRYERKLAEREEALRELCLKVASEIYVRGNEIEKAPTIRSGLESIVDRILAQ